MPGAPSVGGPAARARSRRAALRQVASQWRRRRPLPCWDGSSRPQAWHGPGSSISAILPLRLLLRAQLLL